MHTRRGNWLILDVRAPPTFAGRQGVVFAGGRTFTREVHAGSSYSPATTWRPLVSVRYGAIDKVEVQPGLHA
jgi:hypothetical protein